jgi:ecotin
MNRFLPTLVGIAIAGCAAASPDDMKPFPEAGDGEVRHVIRLPDLDDESAARVELLVGKNLEVDCNQHWFSGNLTAEVVEGWGYSYFRVDGIGGPASTLMACPEGSQEVRFVQVRFDQPLLGYNSRLPIVVYAPEGFEVLYRIWRAGDDIESATHE